MYIPTVVEGVGAEGQRASTLKVGDEKRGRQVQHLEGPQMIG